MELEIEKNDKKYNQIIENSITNEMSIENTLVTAKEQNDFLQTTLGKTVNVALDVGLRWILPDLIENQVIEIKDTLLENGLKAGVDKAIESALDLGKSTIGILTGNFENMSQVQTAVEKGGIIDTVSKTIDTTLNACDRKGLLPNGIGKMIKTSKNVILDNISNNIEKTLTNQIKGVEKLDKYSQNWKQYYNSKNFTGMEKEYQKIKEELTNLVPLESTIKQARQIETLHKLIKNKGQDFNLSQEEIDLAKVFS